MASHGYAIFQRDAVNGNKRDNVSCAHTGMRTLMSGQINQLTGLPHATNSSFLNGLAFADQRDDTAVVVAVHFAIEEIDAIYFHSGDNGIYFGLITTF